MHSTGEIYSFAFWLNDYQLRASALTLEIIRLWLSLRNRGYLSVLATLLVLIQIVTDLLHVSIPCIETFSLCCYLLGLMSAIHKKIAK